jgi:hypothetical protein
MDDFDATAIIVGLLDANWKLDLILGYFGGDDEEEAEAQPDS